MTETATKVADHPLAGELRPLKPAQPLGRYHVLRLIGSGGMGQVYTAYDPNLDRRVAIKLVHAHASSHQTERLTREAKALARLNHPNVVTVHEVATHDGRVVIAMEFVDGCTLKTWSATHPPRSSPTRMIDALELLLQAGRGLAAAHAADLVHRDFKPANVLVGEDGRARVADFGVSRDASSQQTSLHPSSESQERPLDIQKLSSESLTKTGTAVGTPAYMAPEQRFGDPVGPFSDQYSYCLTAWEILDGKRPALSTLHESKAGSHTHLTPAIEAALRKGLADRPSKRHKHFDDLLSILQNEVARLRGRDGVRRRSTRLAGLALGVLALGLGGFAITNQLDKAQCSDRRHVIEDHWNAETRAAVERGIFATEAPYAAVAASGAMHWLDERANAWTQAAISACEFESDETWQPEELSKAEWCLDESRTSLVLLVGALTHADATVVRNATKAAARVQSASECLDRSRLQASPAPPSFAARMSAIQLQSQLLQADNSIQIGQATAARELVVPVRERAEQLGHLPLLANALAIEGNALESLDEIDESAKQLEYAYFMATRGGDWRLASEVASRLAAVVGRIQARPNEGKIWARHAAEAIARSGQENGVAEAERRHTLGWIEAGAGNYDASEPHYVAALDILRHKIGSSHPDTLALLGDLGGAYMRMGKLDKAADLVKSSYEQFEAVLGDDHPDTNHARINYGTVLASLGQNVEAKAIFDRSLVIAEAAETEGFSDAQLHLMMNLAVVSRRLADYKSAHAYYERATVLMLSSESDMTANLAAVAVNRGVLAVSEEDYPSALRFAKEALELRTEAFGPDHEQLIEILHNIAEAQLLLEDAQAALVTCARAFELIDAHKLADTDAPVARVLARAAHARRMLGEYRQALAYLERALAAVPEDTPYSLTIRYALADALWQAPTAKGGDRVRARRLIQTVLDESLSAKDDEEARIAKDWLQEHELEGSP